MKRAGALAALAAAAALALGACQPIVPTGARVGAGAVDVSAPPNTPTPLSIGAENARPGTSTWQSPELAAAATRQATTGRGRTEP